MYHQFIAAAAAVQQLKRVFNDDDDCRGKKIEIKNNSFLI
jgi:hypothetical protein